ncbi:MAG: hypothetical protein H8E85_03400 [Candidatus Marinimicrobia bacterium]|nr:hypothetical protein [Candidatus Neomarinimicrobiota bacterium]
MWSYKYILLRNVLIAAILTSVFSLIIPKTYKSTALLMPPKSQSDQGILANIEGLAFGDFLSSSSDEVSNTIFAILKSRTMMESIVKKMGLIQRYESDNLEEAVKALRDNLSFEHLEEGSISISANVQTPWLSNDQDEIEARKLTAEIVNYILSKLDKVNKTLQTDEARFHRVFMEKRYGESIENLQVSEEKLRLFQMQNNTIDLAEQTKAAIRIGAEIKSQILIDEVKLGILNKTYKQDHPEIDKLTMEIGELEGQLANLDYNSHDSGNPNNNLFPKYSEVPNLEIELMRLQREVEIQSKLYAFLTQKFEESKIQEARDTPTIQILDEASNPIKRFKPKRTIMVIGYSLIAFVLSALFVILIEFNKTGIRSS